MATCKDCLHYEPCYDYGNILDPLGGGVKCDSFKNKADLVEVVRCKDCDFRGTEDCPSVYWLELEGDYVDPTEDDDFCSYGERRNTE